MDRNVEVVKSYFESLATGNFEKLGSLLDENIVWHQPGQGNLSGTYTGKGQVFSLFSKFMERSGGTFQIDAVHDIMSNGPWVMAILHFKASKKSSSMAMNGVDLMRVENGQIKEVFLFSAQQEIEDAFWN